MLPSRRNRHGLVRGAPVSFSRASAVGTIVAASGRVVSLGGRAARIRPIRRARRGGLNRLAAGGIAGTRVARDSPARHSAARHRGRADRLAGGQAALGLAAGALNGVGDLGDLLATTPAQEVPDAEA